MGSGPSNSTSTQSSQPPAWLQGDLQQLGTMGSQAIQQPLQQYQGPLVAGFNPDQQQAFNTINNAQGMAQPYINSGAQYLQNAAKPLWNQDLPQLGQGAVQGMGQQGSGLIGKAANTNIAGAGQPGVNMATHSAQMGQGAAAMGAQQGQFGAQAGIGAANAAANQQFNVQPYMSPYTQNVVDATQRQFNNQNAQQQQGVIGNAISSGAFGGDRAAIAQAETANQEQLAQAPVIAGLYNQGFQNAEQEFNQQQGLRTQTGLATGQLGLQSGIQAGQLGLAGGQLGAQVGQGIAGLGQSAAAQQGQLGLQGGQGLLNEFNQQQQTQLGANQANAWLNSQAGFGMANLGQEAQQSALSGAAAQLQTGGLQQQQAQQQLNIPYEQFLQQQAYPYQQMNWLAGIDEGLGGTAGGTASTTTPGPDETSQVLGGLASVAGIAALALKRGGSVTPHTREPHGDVRAQLGALLDPNSKKDAVFLSPENAAHGVPPLPAHVMRVERGEGVLFTTNAEKAAHFRKTKPDDASLARLLGYPEHKQAALASGNAVVVQARDRSGHVVSEALASPHMLEATKHALQAHAPGGTVHVVSTIAAQQRRVQGHTEGRADGGSVPDVDVNITGEPPIGERGNAPQPMYPPPQKSDSGSGGGGMSLSTIASLASLAGVAMKRGGVIPHYESGGGLGGGGLGGSVPNVDVNYMGEAPKGVHGNAPGASAPQGSSSAGGSSLGDVSSIMGSLDTIYNSGSGGYAPVPLALDAPMMSTSSLDTIGGFVGPTPAPYRRGGLIPQHRASGGGASKFVTNTNSLAGPGGPQVSSALFDRPTGWDAGGGSPGWFQPLAQYKPPGTETQTKTTNNLPNAPDWANSSSKITGDQTNQLFKTMLGRSAGDYAGQVAGKQSVSDVYQGILTSPEYQGLLSSGKVPGETQSSQVTGYTYPHTTFQPFYQAGAAATPTVGGQSLDQYLSSLTGNLALKRGGVVGYAGGGDIFQDAYASPDVKTKALAEAERRRDYDVGKVKDLTHQQKLWGKVPGDYLSVPDAAINDARDAADMSQREYGRVSGAKSDFNFRRGGVVPIRRRDDGGGLTPANDDDAPEPQPMRATGTTGVAPPPPDQPQGATNYQGAIDRFINSPDPQPYKAADTKALREGIEHPHVDPWMSVLAAGLGMLSGTSPHAGVNIGRGAMQGLQEYQRERQQAVQGAEKEFDAEEKAQQLLQEGTRFQSQQAAAKGEMAEKVAHDQREQQYQQGQLGEAHFRDTNTARYQQGELANQRELHQVELSKLGGEAQWKYNTWLTQHPGDTEGALRYANPYGMVRKVGDQLVDMYGNPVGGAATGIGPAGGQTGQPSAAPQTAPVGMLKPEQEIPAHPLDLGPNPSQAARLNLNEQLKTSNTAMGKLDEAASAASQSRADLGNLSNLLQSGGMTTSRFAPIKVALSTYIYGITGDKEVAESLSGIDPAKAEAFNKDATRMGLTFARNTEGAREAVQAIQIALGANPSMTNTVEGNQMVIGLLDAAQRRTLDEQRYAQAWRKTNQHAVGFQEWFNQTHPVAEYTSRVIPYEIPKGMDGKPDENQMQPNVVYRTRNGMKYWDGTQLVPAQ